MLMLAKEGAGRDVGRVGSNFYVFAQLRRASRYVAWCQASLFHRLCTHLQTGVYVSFMPCTNRGKLSFRVDRNELYAGPCVAF